MATQLPALWQSSREGHIRMTQYTLKPHCQGDLKMDCVLEKQEGELWFAKPHCLQWRLGNPLNEIWFYNGQDAYWYQVDLAQVTRYSQIKNWPLIFAVLFGKPDPKWDIEEKPGGWVVKRGEERLELMFVKDQLETLFYAPNLRWHIEKMDKKPIDKQLFCYWHPPKDVEEINA